MRASAAASVGIFGPISGSVFKVPSSPRTLFTVVRLSTRVTPSRRSSASDSRFTACRAGTAKTSSAFTSTTVRLSLPNFRRASS